jgi:hypothetical protein
VYNLLEGARWEPLFLDAMLPDKLAGSRLPVRVDLLQMNPTGPHPGLTGDSTASTPTSTAAPPSPPQ